MGNPCRSCKLTRVSLGQAVSGVAGCAEAIFGTLSRELRERYEAAWTEEGGPAAMRGGCAVRAAGAVGWCRRQFDWPTRPGRGAPGTTAGFRETVVAQVLAQGSHHPAAGLAGMASPRPAAAAGGSGGGGGGGGAEAESLSGRFVIEARTRWDAGVTHIAEFVDRFVVRGGPNLQFGAHQLLLPPR